MKTKLIEAGDLRPCHTLVRFIPGFGERMCDIVAIRRFYETVEVWVDTGLGEERLIFKSSTPVEIGNLHDSR